MAQEKCKNCQEPISKSDKFCKECGGKIVRERITFKTLIADAFWRAVGWDNKFFKTFRNLLLSPQVIFRAYISGVRKRYVNPIAFFAIGMTVSLITFNVFQEHFLELSGVGEVNMDGDFELPHEPAFNFGPGNAPQDPEEVQRQLRFAAEIQKTILKYFNVYSFVLLPFYALVGFLVFGRKRNNYTEQLVINAYIQGFMFLWTTVLFLLTLFTFNELYAYGVVVTIVYYTYAYGRLYEFNFWKSLLYLLKFIAIALGLILIFALVLVLIGMIYAMITK